MSQSWIFMGINPEYSWEGLMLKLMLQYSGHLMRRAGKTGKDSMEKTLMLGTIEGRRRQGNRSWDGWMALLTQWTRGWARFGRWWRTGRSGVLQSIGLQRVRHNWKTEQQQQSSSCVNWSFIFFFPFGNAQLSAYISIGVFAFVFLMINKKIFIKINFCHLRSKQNSFQFVFDTLTLFMEF